MFCLLLGSIFVEKAYYVNAYVLEKSGKGVSGVIKGDDSNNASDQLNIHDLIRKYNEGQDLGWGWNALVFFGGLVPLCGIGVVSLIDKILNPLACKALNAVSLPEPGPFISTDNVFIPNSKAFVAAESAAI